MTLAVQTRQRLLVGAAASGLVFVLLTLLVWLKPAAMNDLDSSFGSSFLDFTLNHDAVEKGARVVAQVFATIPMALYTISAVALLTLRGFRRTAVWVAIVMVGCSLTTTLVKLLVDRDRPLNALVQLTDRAFPSGHTSSVTAAAGVAMVLGSMFLRRRNQRRAVVVLASLLVVVVGFDRILLGVHGLTDVIAGLALGILWVCASAYLYDPTPRTVMTEPLPSALPVTRSLAVVLNPIKVESTAAFKELVNRRATALGWSEPTWFETTIEDPGRSMAHDAAVGGADLVVVCGGDGTVRTVCAELAGTGIPVGVVPAGTGNLLARNLDLPLYLNAAIDVALNGQDRAIDLVRVNGDGLDEEEHFLVMAGMGFDAAIMEGANEQIKAKVGWLAYVVSGLRNLMFPAIRIEISIDDGPFTKHRARTVLIGNVGFLQAGLPLLPDATIDDGRIDLVIVNPKRFLSWLRVVVRVVTRARRTDDTVNRMTGRKIVVRTPHEAPRQIDGDPIGAGHELVCECLPGKLLIRVPR